MSNITVTGNEAQFNEKVTFLKDVEIRGTLSVPTITGQATFLDRVNFAKDITFPEIEIKNKLSVGAGGTLFVADTSNGDGRVGIGSTNPTELLDVSGRAKIIDLELQNLNVLGISTFIGNSFFNSDVFVGSGATVGFLDNIYIADNKALFLGHDNDLKIYHSGADSFIDEQGLGELHIRANSDITVEKTSGALYAVFDDSENSVKLFNTGVKKFETIGTGVSVSGDIVVDDVGIRTSRVGIGTLDPTGMHPIDDIGNGPLRLTVDGSVSISRNIYDSAGSPGFNGYFLQRDGNGIRWSAFEPEETQGIRIQDEGTFIPTVGTAKTYSIVNFASINSFGQGTDTIRPEDGIGAGLATVFTFDLWGFKSRNVANSPIYRMSPVGIGTTNPSDRNTFEVHTSNSVVAFTSTGQVGIGLTAPTQTFRVIGDTQLIQLNTIGIATFLEDTKFEGANADILFDKSDNAFEFVEGTKIGFGETGQPYGMEIKYDNGSGVIQSLNNDELKIKSDSNIIIQRQGSDDKMIEATPLGAVSLLHGRGSVGASATSLETTSTGVNVIGETETDTLNVTETSILVGVTTQQSTLFSNQINNLGVSTFVGITTQQSTLFTNQLTATGFSTFNGITTSTSTLFANEFIVAGVSTFEGSIDANADVDIALGLTVGGDTDLNGNLDVDGHTELDDLNVAGVSTFNDDVTFVGASKNILFDSSGNALAFQDDAVARFGDGNDLNIFHNGLDSYIAHTGIGSLVVRANSFNVRNVLNNEDYITAKQNESVNLYYDNVKRFSTSGIGATVYGQLDTNDLNVTGFSTFGNDVKFTGQNYDAFWDNSVDALQFSDNAKATFGNHGGAGNLQIYSTGTDSYINNTVGDFFILQNDSSSDIKIQGETGTNSIVVDGGGIKNVTLFANGAPKLATSNTGIDVTGLTDTDTLNVSETSTFVGFATFNNEINVGGFSTFAKDVDINANVDISGDLNVAQTLDVDGLSELDDLNVSGISSFVGISTFKDEVGIAKTLDLGSHIRDINQSIGVGAAKTDYRLSSVGTGVSWRPSGVQTKRTIWVSKNGNDNNSGLLEGDAKATIGGAAAVAVETDTIKVRPGVYEENNPIGLRTDVTVTGEDLRLVIIQSKNPFKDVFHVRRGCLVENLNFGGSNVGVSHDGAACVAFPPLAGANSAVSGYTAPGPATEGPSGRWRSPYVRNCTNFMTGSIGMKIDGDNATASTKGADLKSMVCDSFTQYNEAGVGVSLTNDAYAQLVSIFTINTDIGIFAGTGAQCDLTNSNSSFGNFGLVAVGLGSTQFTGIVSNTNTANELITSTLADNQDTVVCANVRDDSDGNATPPFTGEVRRPFDGQALYFKINLDNYPDAQGSGRITAPLQQLKSISLIPGADVSGFSAIDPPNVLIRDADNTVEPKGPQGIIAEASAAVSPTGDITSVGVVAQGRNYLPTQNIVVDIEGDTGIATAIMEPIYFTVEEATVTELVTGITTVTFNEFIPYELFPDDPFSLQRISRILTSSHSFEYVGTGTDINIATPLQGAIPIKENEIVAKDGAQIPFTSTDQKGNFDIGAGLQINQTTSSITGRDFSRSIQAEVTPLILALR